MLAVAVIAATSTGSVAAATGAPGRALSAADAGAVGVRLLDVPAALADDERARRYIVGDLAPGTGTERRMEVSNTTASSLDVDVYVASARISGGAFVGDEGRAANELSSWTTVSDPTVAVPAGGAAELTIRVDVPLDAAPGEQYAVVWAEVRAEQEGGISVVSRAGIRMYVAASGDNPLPSAFTVDTITAERDASGGAVVLAEVHNTGGRALDLSGELSLSAVTGSIVAGPYPLDESPTLAPGESLAITFAPTDQVTDGPWDAAIALRSGSTAGAYQARITFPASPGAAEPSPAAHVPGGITWWMVVLGIVALSGIVLVAAIVPARRRRRSVATDVIDVT